jgi:hypothetical protein
MPDSDPSGRSPKGGGRSARTDARTASEGHEPWRPGEGWSPDAPVVRPLKAYAFDPSAGRLLGNALSLPVRYQDLDPGPVVRDPHAHDGIAVIDYDGATAKWYRPVDLDDPYILIRGGLDPSESDPRFHQQMVYAVATETIQHFEAALGRQIHWRRAERKDGRPVEGDEDIHTLCLYPHAMVSANAFYSPKAHGILFGYFRADKDDPGRNLPGQLVYTCLSHDIVVHEITHAIIDGIRLYFTEPTNPDVAAFHEAFADLAALFRHFTHREVLLDTIERTGGVIHQFQLQDDLRAAVGGPGARRDTSERASAPGAEKRSVAAELGHRNPLVQLAQQFGEARGMNQGLRSALGTEPVPEDMQTVFEPHRRGSILVAAVFDAYFSIYLRRTLDLFRIFRSGGGNLGVQDVPAPLARRLADEASRTAELFFKICVRALDYCPPVDITFGDFLRAVVTADFDLHPEDDLGIRDAMMESCRRRGIIPESASFFSEASIAWPRATHRKLPRVTGLDFGDPNGLTDDQQTANKKALKRYLEDPSNLAKLDLDPNLQIEVPSFHPVFRVNSDGSLRTDMVVEVVQRQDCRFDEGVEGLGTFPVRGGATVILSKPTIAELRNGDRDATVRYVIGKQVGAAASARVARQRRFAQLLGLVEGNDRRRFQIDFALVHGGF